MSYPILTANISRLTLVPLRDRTRQIGELFGLGKLENTQFITAVSEIARNTVQYAEKGTVSFQFRETSESGGPQSVIAVVTDKGPGITDIEQALSGRSNGKAHKPLGITGARRLVNGFDIVCPDCGGTRVTLEMHLPRNVPRLTRETLSSLTNELAQRKPTSALEEMEKHHDDMLVALQQLQNSQKELELADERKNRFLATLAHELRNPLATLSMNLEIMNRNANSSPEEAQRRRDAMKRQTEQMSRLIEDIMDVSRISQGKLELRMESLELNELLAQTIEMSASATAARQHRVTFTPHEYPVWIRGDPTRLMQTFSNLLQNAARYTPKGGELQINVTNLEGTACIVIADNGIGISEAMLPQIFDIFVQADNRSTIHLGGLGIGLTLVQRFVEAHGGTVKASSEGEGKGSQFTVTLPTKSC